jgi:hypothetical protein
MAKKTKQPLYVSGGYIDLDKTKVLHKGKRITEVQAEKLAVETSKRLRGRPSLSKRNEESPIIQFRIAKTKKRAIAKKAKSQNISESELLRRAVDLVLASN